MIARLATTFAAAAALAACASAEPDTRWTPRADADLAADLAACQREANGIDVRAGGGTADDRYNSAAAMAQHYDRQNTRSGASDRMYLAVRDSCMIRRGWTRAE